MGTSCQGDAVKLPLKDLTSTCAKGKGAHLLNEFIYPCTFYPLIHMIFQMLSTLQSTDERVENLENWK